MNKPANERVYQYVRDKIVTGKVAGGTFIEEQDISEQTGVSRTPVREAFLRLEAEHFLELIPRRGALVRQITADELKNVYEARQLIEVHAALRICEDPSINVPDDMDELLFTMDQAAENDDYIQYIMTDLEFHRRIVATTHNNVLLEMYDSLQGRKLRVTNAALNVYRKRSTMVKVEHLALLDALKKRNAELAEKTLKNHLRPLFEIISTATIF